MSRAYEKVVAQPCLCPPPNFSEMVKNSGADNGLKVRKWVINCQIFRLASLAVVININYMFSKLHFFYVPSHI